MSRSLRPSWRQSSASSGREGSSRKSFFVEGVETVETGKEHAKEVKEPVRAPVSERVATPVRPEPVAEERKPVAEERKPVAEERKPVAPVVTTHERTTEPVRAPAAAKKPAPVTPEPRRRSWFPLIVGLGALGLAALLLGRRAMREVPRAEAPRPPTVTAPPP